MGEGVRDSDFRVEPGMTVNGVVKIKEGI